MVYKVGDIVRVRDVDMPAPLKKYIGEIDQIIQIHEGRITLKGNDYVWFIEEELEHLCDFLPEELFEL